VENDIISLTAHLVSAHVAANEVSVEQLPGLIREVHGALATVGRSRAELIKAEPAVTVEQSVFVDHILCLDCGQSFKVLKGHIWSSHHMKPAEYRAKWNLPASYSMVAAEFGVTRSKLAKRSGLGRKVEGPPPPKKAGRHKRK
jgi:predicted transcriptional regulator